AGRIGLALALAQAGQAETAEETGGPLRQRLHARGHRVVVVGKKGLETQVGIVEQADGGLAKTIQVGQRRLGDAVVVDAQLGQPAAGRWDATGADEAAQAAMKFGGRYGQRGDLPAERMVIKVIKV